MLRRGLALVTAGKAGKGLRGETTAWARDLADGLPVTPAKARLMRAWFARHGAAKAESARRMRDPESPAAVAWLLWGGDPSVPYRRDGWSDPVAAWLRSLPAESPKRQRNPAASKRVCVTPTAPEKFRVYGTLKTLHGVRVVEVHTGFYLSADLQWQAINRRGDVDGESGWVVSHSTRNIDGGVVLRNRREAIEALNDMVVNAHLYLGNYE